MRFLLCGDVRHTLGATEYAWLSYLAFALRLRQIAPVELAMPLSLGGLSADMTVTRASLESFARRARILLHTTDDLCDHERNDIRITDRLTATNARLATLAGAMAAPVFNASSPRKLDAFLDGIWAFLRAAVTLETAGPLRVSISLVQATAGPLAHASAALHAEALSIIRALEIAPAPSQAVLQRSEASMGGAEAAPTACAYVFLGLFMGVGPIALSTPQQKHTFESDVASVVARASAALGVRCAVLNAVFKAEDASHRTALGIFQRVDSSLAVSLVPKVHFRGPLAQWRDFASEAQGKAQAGKQASNSTSASFALHVRASSQAPREKGGAAAELAENLIERHAAYSSPLLIAQSGTYWSDWLLARRTSERRPSVVLANAASRRGTRETRACGGAMGAAADACGGCVFYRGHCVPAGEGWLGLMGSEVGLCARRWQHEVAHSTSGKGVQRVALVGC